MDNDFKDIDYTTDDKQLECKIEHKEPEQKIEEKQPELFSSMNEVSEGDSKMFRNGMLGILLLFIIFLGKMCAQYAIKQH